VDADQTARFERVVDFWNRGLIVTAEDAIAVVGAFAVDPLAVRRIESADPELATPTPFLVKRRVFYGPSIPGISVAMVSSGTNLPPGTKATDGRVLTAAGELVPADSPEGLLAGLEGDRLEVGRVLAALAGHDARGLDYARRWAYAKMREYIEPFAVFDSDAPLMGRVWLGGVTACCVIALWDFCKDTAAHERLWKCGAPDCLRFVFTRPGTVGRPRKHCSPKHNDQARDATPRARA
jgi:hypothetical protein